MSSTWICHWDLGRGQKFGASLLTVNRRLYIEARHLCGEHSSNYLEKREREEFTLIFFREFEIVSC
ncbi:hypothetical protein Q6314_26760, partial [Klebsiella pneumoniae]